MKKTTISFGIHLTAWFLIASTLAAAPSLYVVTGDNLLRYNAASGRFIGIVGTQPGASAGSYTGVWSGPDGAVYTMSSSGVWRWNVENGTASQIVEFGAEVRVVPAGIAFGSDGLLYVVTGDNLLRYDVASGQFLGVVATQPGASAGSYTGVWSGPDGGVYTMSSNGIWRWDIESGTASQVVEFGPEVPVVPAGVVVSEDGHIYVVSGDMLLAYDFESGEFLGVVGEQAGASAGSYSGLGTGFQDNILSLVSGGIWSWNRRSGSARELVTFGPEVPVVPAGFVVIPTENGRSSR